MRQASVLLFVAAAALLLATPLLSPRGTSVRAPIPCGAGLGAMATAHVWVGSLQGWPESGAGLAWRAAVARAKGRPAPQGCG